MVASMKTLVDQERRLARWRMQVDMHTDMTKSSQDSGLIVTWVLSMREHSRMSFQDLESSIVVTSLTVYIYLGIRHA